MSDELWDIYSLNSLSCFSCYFHPLNPPPCTSRKVTRRPQFDWETGMSYFPDVTPLIDSVPLADRLPRIPAPACACLRPSDRIPARPRAMEEEARSPNWGLPAAWGAGREGEGALVARRKRRVQWKVPNLVRGNSFQRQTQQ